MTGHHVSRWWSPGGSQSLERVLRKSRHVGRAAVPPDTSDTATEGKKHRRRCVDIFNVKRMEMGGMHLCSIHMGRKQQQ